MLERTECGVSLGGFGLTGGFSSVWGFSLPPIFFPGHNPGTAYGKQNRDYRKEELFLRKTVFSVDLCTAQEMDK